MTENPTETAPALVVNISLGPSSRDYDEVVTFLDRPFRLVRQGTDGKVKVAEDLTRDWSADADCIAVTGIREARAAGLYDGELAAIERVMKAASGVRVTNGHALRDVLQEWAIRRVQNDMPGYFNNARTLVLGGVNHARATRILAEYTQNLIFEDPILRFDIPSRLDDNPLLGVAANVGMWPVRHLPGAVKSHIRSPGLTMSRALARRSAPDSDVVVATFDELMGFGLQDLSGKTVVTSAVSDERLAELKRRGVDMILDATPQPFPEVTVVAAVLEAMMLVVAETEPGRLTNDDLLDMIISANLEPRVLWPNGFKRRSRFAFVIHPLSQQFFSSVEPLGTIAKVSPPVVMDAMEKALAYAPPFMYSRVTGIKSPTGAEAEGWLITVGGTPKELMSHSPEFTYGRLLAAAESARKLGAQVMGLGAFTKVVGDAGVTVAKKAPLPITTGNSYSASGALWAAHDALMQLGLIESDEDGRLRGSAMVVGATGAIGSVCSRLLALSSDVLYLVSPETAKLLALKEDIERSNPRAEIRVAATPGEHLGECDLIVTATSGAGKRVLDIMAVKPGAVITDVARPLDLSAEDVARRPDILVVESGEIKLPGENVRMKNIGLPRSVVYACLAETVVLALEGRFETFTVGRNIEWEKVKEIYRLGLKHGMKLAAISGVNGVYTEEDIAKVRELALIARKEAAERAAADAAFDAEAAQALQAQENGADGDGSHDGEHGDSQHGDSEQGDNQ